MSNSMHHWQGHQVCAIDVETTGLNPNWHEMIQICILPLDSDFLPRQDVVPFYIYLVPDYPERAAPKAMSINRLDFANVALTGHDREKAKDLLEDWITSLDLSYTKSGDRKKIMPLGQNYAFDLGFIKAWLGDEMYNEIFHYHYKDTMIVANFLNDHAAVHAEAPPFPRIGLSYLCTRLKIHRERSHDALQDCIATAKVWRALVNQGLVG